MNNYQLAHYKLDSIVRGALRAQAERAIRRYFEEPTVENGRIGYTGRRFERVDGGGDRPGVCNTVTPADVIAVTLLGIENGIGRVALAVIEDRHAEIARLLRDVPLSAIGPESAAWRLWELLCQCGGERRSVTAYKLLARKRPALLPIYDAVVKAQLDAPADVWDCYWSWFNTDPSRVRDAEALRSAVGEIEDISLLRCLDVALWMIGTDRG